MKLSFSERNGLVELPPQYLREQLTPRLRNRLAGLAVTIVEIHSSLGYIPKKEEDIFRKIWTKYLLKDPASFSSDEDWWKQVLSRINREEPYNTVLDFWEFFIDNIHAEGFEIMVAEIFEGEVSAYRLVDKQFFVVSSDEERDTFSDALHDLSSVNAKSAIFHIKRAAAFIRSSSWADSIRESIHAVESVANIIAPSNSLGKALEQIDKNRPIHPALKDAFKKLYGYTSDESGIRHAAFDDDRTPTEAEALFMLSACAAFSSYLANEVRQLTS